MKSQFSLVAVTANCCFALFSRKGQEPSYTTLSGHSGPVTCCALNSIETRLASGSRDMVSLLIFVILNAFIHHDCHLEDTSKKDNEDRY